MQHQRLLRTGALMAAAATVAGASCQPIAFNTISADHPPLPGAIDPAVSVR